MPEAMDLRILHEDADLLVVDKPAGLVVHPAPGHKGGTLVHGLLHHVKDLSGIGGVIRPGINATLAAKMLFGSLDEMATNWMLSHRRSSLDGVADAVVDVFVHGIGVPAPEGRP